MIVLRHDAPVVTVFGGTGFLGKYVVWRLARKGFVIRIPTRHPNRVLPLQTNGAVGQITAIPTNIHNQDSVARAVAGSDYVINLIGVLFEKGKRQTFKKLHVDFPAMLAAVALQHNVKQIVHVSALGADLLSSSVYACTKATGEIMLHRIFPKTVVIRPGVMFGDEDNFINKFARLARLSPILPLMGKGETVFQPVYVGDVADVVVHALGDEDAQGQVYLLGGPRRYNFEELLMFIQNVTGEKRILFPVPFGVMKFKAWFLEKFPKPLITRDQIEMLKTDNVLPDNITGFESFDIIPSSLEAVAPRYLGRFRKGGRFAKPLAA